MPRRTLLQLSRGGADATVLREFDLVDKAFVPESEGGFVVPEAKSRASWSGKDCLLVGTDLGEGDMTDSGYPRTVREWRRGTALADAPVVYEGSKADISVGGYRSRHQGVRLEWRSRSTTFYTGTYMVRRLAEEGAEQGPWVDLEGVVPEDAELGQFGDQLLVSLRSAWHGHRAGSLLAAPLDALSGISAEAMPGLLTSLFAPTDRCALEGYTRTKDKLLLSLLDNVKSRTTCLSYNSASATWLDDDAAAPPVEPTIGGVSISAVDADRSNLVWCTTNTFTQPNALSLGDVSSGVASLLDSVEQLRSLPAAFDAAGLEVNLGLYKIFFHLFLCVQESIIPSVPPPS